MSKVIFDKKNILITGGAGFIGSHLCDELVKDSQVICLDNFASSRSTNIEHLLPNPNFVFINWDISNPINLSELPELRKFKVAVQGIQEIYNLACPTSPKNFSDDRQATLLANSVGMRNILDMAVSYGAKLLHFSSSVIYGERREDVKLVKEDYQGLSNHLSARACYDEGKRFAETMVSTYKSIFNIDAKIIRIFRTYGPRMMLNDGQMLPDFINDALENKDLVIYGDENFSSSFCYVSDVVDAAQKLMHSQLSGPINVGSDENVKVKDIADIVISETESKSQVVFQPRQLFMSELPLPDITMAKNDLAWMPVVTLKNGIKKTIFDLQAKRQMKGLGISE
jgi:UDP-glucuronate decarboxylase